MMSIRERKEKRAAQGCRAVLYPRFLSCLCLCLMFCSCSLELGEYIRAEDSPCTVDLVLDPATQPVYRLNENVYAMEIPEWQATRHPGFFRHGIYLSEYNFYNYIKKTGKSSWVARYRASPEYCWFTMSLDEKPDLTWTRPFLLSEVDATIDRRARFGEELADASSESKESPSVAKKILAAPFDYLIDPVGSCVGTSIYLGCSILGGLMIAPTYLFQQKEKVSPQEVVPYQYTVPESWR